MLVCEKATEPDGANVVAFQAAGCHRQFFRGTANDSCFSYQFHAALVVEFCVLGNCCPDSDRFTFKHTISHDTIMVTIADTAAHLCRCVCPYVLHMEFRDLPGDSYVFYCSEGDSSDLVVLYSERVRRN
jgi:hypothetical protein